MDHKYKHAIRSYVQLVDACDPVTQTKPENGETYPSRLYRLARQYINAVDAQPYRDQKTVFTAIEENAWREE